MAFHSISAAQTKLGTDFVVNRFTGLMLKEHIHIYAFASVYESSNPTSVHPLIISSRWNVGKGVELAIDDDIVIVGEVNPVRRNQFRRVQRSFHAFLIRFGIALNDGRDVVVERNSLTLAAVQHLIKQLMNTGIFITAAVAQSRDEDIAALFHVGAYVSRHCIKVRNHHIKVRAVIADGTLKLNDDKETARNTNGQSRLTKQADVSFQHPLALDVCLFPIIGSDCSNRLLDICFTGKGLELDVDRNSLESLIEE